jgi:hypothetical protein
MTTAQRCHNNNNSCTSSPRSYKYTNNNELEQGDSENTGDILEDNKN